jgi:hypothetical protein
MLVMDAIGSMVELSLMNHCDAESRVRIHIGNLLYDIDYIDAVIDMDTNKQNIVIHVKEN